MSAATRQAAQRLSLILLAVVCLMAGALVGVSSAAAAGLVSDDFSAGSLGSQWSVVDPVGDGVVSFAGQGTSGARAELGVPAGSSHDAWGVNRSLRLVQQVSDSDLVVEAKFDSVPSRKFQSQGLLFEQDVDDWVRFDVYSDGSRLHAFGASTEAGVSTKRFSRVVNASLSMRIVVSRSGATWQMQVGADTGPLTTVGSFTEALTLTKAGPFASNHGSGAAIPAWTSLVDYVFDTASPIVPEDGDAGPGDTIPPVVSGVTVSPSSQSAVVAWDTNELTSGAVEYGATASLGTQAPSPAPSMSHSVALTGLVPETTYHYRVVATDAGGNLTTTPVQTLTTNAGPPTGEEPPGAAGLVSDDFSAGSLGSQWSVVDPVGDGVVSFAGQGTSGARAELGVPAGSSHDAWGVNRSLRLVQQVSDSDLVVEAKFDSVPSRKFQSQGLLFEQDVDDWVRFDVYSDGSRLHAFGASTEAGVSTKRFSRVVNASLSMRIVVSRSGATWQMQVGADTGPLTTVGSFTEALTLTKAGPFASNHGSGAAIPAWTSLVDYVFDTASPIVPEDGDAGPGDTIPPVVSGVTVSPSSQSAVVAWDTNELTSGAVEYGATASLGTQAPSPAPSMSHSVALTGLVPETTYHYRVVATDAGGNLTTTPVQTLTTNTAEPDEPPEISSVQVSVSTNRATVTWSTSRSAVGEVLYGPSSSYGASEIVPPGTTHSAVLTDLDPGTSYHYQIVATATDGLSTRTADATFTTTTANSGPQIDLWYGRLLAVGGAGRPQNWVNVLGRVTDPDSVMSLSYKLDGGAARGLTIGPDNRRLQQPGDFNADIPWDELPTGDTAVQILAVDSLGATTSETVVLRKLAAVPVTPPLTRAWDVTTPLDVQALPVDGRWVVEDGTVRSVDPGYDRVLALGDVGWTDYEVTVPITPLAQGPDAFSYLSGAPMLGVGMRWSGHDVVDGKQPAWGFYGTGAYAWIRWHESGTKIEVKGTGGSPTRTRAKDFAFGTTQVLKLRAETLDTGGTQYSVKSWPQGAAEPAVWEAVIAEPDGPASGSLVLISHHLDATFGEVSIVPLQP